MEKYFVFFSNASGIGPKTFLKLLNTFKTPEKIYKASKSDLERAGLKGKSLEKYLTFKSSFDLNKYLEKMEKTKVEYVSYGDKYYPEGLIKIDSPPIGLFVKGNKYLLNKPGVAVVGARRITSYGRSCTQEIVSDLASRGIVITSGMALGVDRVAHEKAIENNGYTIAVLGCGVDCPYPRENEKLYEQILDSKGLIISEYPLGMSANAGTFPARNRIIAGISEAVLVTEAAESSGSLITASYALKFGKKLFAVPGPINSAMSRGSLKLLKEGAVLVSSGEDILQELSIKNYELRNNSKKPKGLKLNKDEKKVYEALENESLTIDQIGRLTKISVGKLMVVLTDLELSGIVIQQNGKWELKM